MGSRVRFVRARSVRLVATAFAAASLLAVRTAPAASPDGMLLPGEKVRDTLSPDGETRTAGFAGLAGMRCTFTARALPKSRVTPTLAVTDPAGDPVVLGRRHRAKGGRATVSGLVLDATGNWRISLTTPKDRGGAFELSAAARIPGRATKKGAAAGDPPTGEASFDALPGTALSSLTVTVTSKPAWTPSIELVAPDGTSLGTAAGKGVRAAMKGLTLPDLGAYRVVVTGGAGRFTVAASLRPPRRSARTWQGAEARPEIRSVSPLAVQNDSRVDLTLDGVGFSTRQTLRLTQNGATKFATPIGYASQTGAFVQAELPGLPPGNYDVQIGTPAANSVIFGTPLVLSNRPPGILRVQPALLPNGATWDVLVTGAGFDPGVQVTVRRRSDGLAIPSAMISRTSHTTADVAVSPGSTTTGPCDVEIRDPDGSGTVFPNAIDLLGWRAAPRAFRTYTGSDSDTRSYPRDAAYDPVSKYACLALREGPRAVWILVDTTNSTVVDTVTVTIAGSTFDPNPRVAWNALDRTWALCWTTNSQGNVRIVNATSLSSTVAQHVVGTAGVVEQVHAAADPSSGGFVVIHDRWGGGTSDGEIWALRVASDGTADTSKQTKVASGPSGLAYDGSIARLAPGRFVVAYVGADDDLTKYAIRRVVLDGNGAVFLPSVICAGVGDWQGLYQPEVALNPDDGTMLMAFTYTLQNTYRPACILLDAGTASPGEVLALDDEGVRPQGFIDSTVWNPSRKEFVIGLSIAGAQVAIRRVTPAGKIVTAQYLQQFEGIWAVLWAGPDPDTLGLVFAFDGVDNAYFGGTGRMLFQGGPFR